jgi:hypothetical protein
MKPEPPTLEDAHTGGKVTKVGKNHPEFRRHAFPGTVLHSHRSGCPLKNMRGSLAHVGWLGFVCIGPIPDQLALILQQALRSIHLGAAMQHRCQPVGA